MPATTYGTSTTSSRDSPRTAEALVERLLTATERLAAFPESGRVVPEFPELGYREIIVSSDRVLYRLRGQYRLDHSRRPRAATPEG